MPDIAVVTGAGRGFGREIAQLLSGRGYTVLATDIDADDDVRLLAEVNLLGVIRGSRAAIDAMRGRGGAHMHVVPPAPTWT